MKSAHILPALALLLSLGCATAPTPAQVSRDAAAYAARARAEFPWCRSLPEPIFREFVAPVSLLDETRDASRPVLYAKFSPLVKDCKTAEEALAAVQKNIVAKTGANYDTRREKANQSPLETMKSGMASCTGLSILLAQSCRAVGIPARVAGVADWSDHSGNHTWVEVWVNGGWHFTEYCPDPKGLDRGWILDRLVNVDAKDPLQAVWASGHEAQLAPSGVFPLVWCEPEEWHVPADNVSARYQALAHAQVPSRAHLVRVRVEVVDARGARLGVPVQVTQADGAACATGASASAKDDLNRHLEFWLPPGKAFEVKAQVGGRTVTAQVTTVEKQKGQGVAVKLAAG